MNKEAKVYAVSRWQVFAIVGAIFVAALSMPVILTLIDTGAAQ